jgi:hypothetical protein
MRPRQKNSILNASDQLAFRQGDTALFHPRVAKLEPLLLNVARTFFPLFLGL